MSRKHTRRAMSRAHQLVGNPVTQAVLELHLKRALADLQTEAGLQVYIGSDAKTILKRVGKLCFVANNTAALCGISPENPDVRIIAGMAGALQDLLRPGETVDKHRAALRSGLAACQRILSQCDVWQAGKALLAAEHYINQPVAQATQHAAPTCHAP